MSCSLFNSVIGVQWVLTGVWTSGEIHIPLLRVMIPGWWLLEAILYLCNIIHDPWCTVTGPFISLCTSLSISRTLYLACHFTDNSRLSWDVPSSSSRSESKHILFFFPFGVLSFHSCEENENTTGLATCSRRHPIRKLPFGVCACV